MNAKKTLTGIILSAYLAIASPLAFSQHKPEHRLRFSLSRYDTPYFNHLQEHMKAFGRDYNFERDYKIFKAPGDNIPIFVPINPSRYSMRIVGPGLEWMLPRDWMRKELYNNNKYSRGILLYEWKHN